MRGYKIPKQYDPDYILAKLETLLRFLNFDFETATPEAFDELAVEFKSFGKFPTQKKAYQTQQQLKALIVSIIVQRKKGNLGEALDALQRMIARINQIPLNVLWAIRPLEYDDQSKLSRDEIRRLISRVALSGDNIFEVGGYKWVLGELWQSRRRDTFEDVLYFTFCLHVLLRCGILSRLRMCKTCGKLFAQNDPRKEFCSAGCKDAFHNERRAKTGYFTERRRRLRKDMRRSRLG